MKELDKYLKDLPVIPDVALKIISLAEDNVDLSFNDLEEIIKVDTAITSKILKVANSALYARQTEIRSLEKAISLLGFKTIKNLVLILSANSAFKSESNEPFYKQFWSNSVLTAFYSKELAIELGEQNIADEVFLAGLIHKIGQVALYRENSDYYHSISEIGSSGLNIVDIEQHYFKTDHKELGANILKVWSFPELFIDCTREYGLVNIISKYKKEILIVTLADIITKEVLSGKEIFKEFADDNSWIQSLGYSIDSFILKKDEIINRVKNNQEFKACQNIFS